MMTSYLKTAVFLLVITAFEPCSGQSISGKKYSSLAREGIKGRVAATETSRYTIDTVNKIVRQDSCCITRTEFDKNGNSIKMERLTLSGNYQGGTVSRYHPNGLLKQIRFLNKDKRETAVENYFIDKAGNYTGGEAYDEGKLLRTFKITSQNEYGQWTRLTWYSLDGKIYRDEIYTYDKNRKIKEIWNEFKNDSNGKIVQDITTEYNERGEMISQKGIHTFLGTVNEKSDRIFEYDKNGNWIQYIILNASGTPIRIFKRSLIYF